MKSGGSQHGDDSDVFGPASSRVYGSSGGFVTKLRPTMISAKYRLKEERRKVLKISINKLRKIEDPESSLRRSVLINNTMKRLQREAREEKLQKQYPNRCYNTNQNQDTPPAVSSTTPLPSREANKENASPFPVEKTPQQDAKPVSRLVVCDESIEELVDAVEESSTPTSRKRPFDEVEDCDVQDVLSQFYMPPTPRMLTSIDDTDDEDEDVNVVDIDIVTSDMTLSSALQSSGVLTPEPSKRPRLEESVSKRPRFQDEDDNVEVNVVDIEMSLASSLHGSCDKRPRFEDSAENSAVGVVVGQLEQQNNDECDRLCRTLISSPPPPSPVVPQTSDDPEDIEVVLEDNEDVERRLFLCSNASRTKPRPEDNSVAASWRSQQPSSDADAHLRFDSNNDKNMMSQCANFCLGSNNNNGMVLDTSSEHQYSCGHSSMFGEIQSVVYHSLIASLES